MILSKNSHPINMEVIYNHGIEINDDGEYFSFIISKRKFKLKYQIKLLMGHYYAIITVVDGFKNFKFPRSNVEKFMGVLMDFCIKMEKIDVLIFDNMELEQFKSFRHFLFGYYTAIYTNFVIQGTSYKALIKYLNFDRKWKRDELNEFMDEMEKNRLQLNTKNKKPQSAKIL